MKLIHHAYGTTIKQIVDKDTYIPVHTHYINMHEYSFLNVVYVVCVAIVYACRTWLHHYSFHSMRPFSFRAKTLQENTTRKYDIYLMLQTQHHSMTANDVERINYKPQNILCFLCYYFKFGRCILWYL